MVWEAHQWKYVELKIQKVEGKGKKGNKKDTRQDEHQDDGSHKLPLLFQVKCIKKLRKKYFVDDGLAIQTSVARLLQYYATSNPNWYVISSTYGKLDFNMDLLKMKTTIMENPVKQIEVVCQIYTSNVKTNT